MTKDTSGLFTEHLTMPETLKPVLSTHLGQAHFGGTGPKGKTCRHCEKWYLLDDNGNKKCPPL